MSLLHVKWEEKTKKTNKKNLSNIVKESTEISPAFEMEKMAIFLISWSLYQN